MVRKVQIVDVGPRDGPPPIGPIKPIRQKIRLIADLYHAGLRRIEVAALVSDKAMLSSNSRH